MKIFIKFNLMILIKIPQFDDNIQHSMNRNQHNFAILILFMKCIETFKGKDITGFSLGSRIENL